MRSALSLLVLLAATAPGWAVALADLLAEAPVVAPQPDGVLHLAPAAAAIVQSGDRPQRVVNGRGLLRVEDGRITRWNGDRERPFWRVRVAHDGWYRLVVNRAAPAGHAYTVAVHVRAQAGERRFTQTIPPTGAWDRVEPFVMGEQQLAAGEQVVEWRPLAFTSPTRPLVLADLRLIPTDALRRAATAVTRLYGKHKLAAAPELAPLVARQQALAVQAAELNREVRRRDFAEFRDYARFVAYDAARPKLAAVETELAEVDQRLAVLYLAKIDGAPLTADERAQVAAYHTELAAVEQAASHAYPLPAPWAPRPPARATLFPPGGFDELPVQAIDPQARVVELTVTPPADLAERRARFAARNSDAGLADLCRRLAAALVPGTPGLEAFERLHAAGRAREALAAYRDYFFAKLADPERFGACTENILYELTRDRGKGHLLLAPSPLALERNLRDEAVAMVGNELVVARLGPPGSACWAPPDLVIPAGAGYGRGPDDHPFWKTDAGRDLRRRIEFYRWIVTMPSDSGSYFGAGFFPALVGSYAVTGNRVHLARWCAWLDDWAMNARRDLDNCPANVRAATELETQKLRASLTYLRLVLDERPEFARDFDPATLARFLLVLVADRAPYTIRAKRAELANWGIMGICHLLTISRFLPEFHAMRYFGREAWRLWCSNWIQHRTLDGENAEAWDEGHNGVDLAFADDCVPYAALPPGLGELDLLAFWDHARVNQRSLLTHLSPDGYYWPPQSDEDARRHSLRGRYLRPEVTGHYYLDLVDQEPEAAARIAAITSEGRLGQPTRRSDFAPYAAMAYLRDGWQPGDEYLLLQDFRERSQSAADCARTAFTLAKGGRSLLEAHALAVDRRPPNRYYGRPRTGGKTDFCGQVGRHVVDSRFHSSERFDLAEARQDSPYARLRVGGGREDWWNLYREVVAADEPDAVRDVAAQRLVFHARGEGLWVICDRIANRSGAAHEYTQCLAFPLRLRETGFADRVRVLAAAGRPLVAEDEAGAQVRTALPDGDNVTVAFFGPPQLTFANALNARGQHEKLRDPLALMQEALKGGRSSEDVVRRRWNMRPVTVRWTAPGNQVLVSVLATRPAGSDQDLRELAPLPGTDGVAGFRAVTRSGAEVWFQSGPRPTNALRAGPVALAGEALFVVRAANGVTSGLALGTRDAGLPPDAEFTLVDGRPHLVAPIRRPIDTVRIRPACNVFTDTVQVSFDLPTQPDADVEFHYTLDGSEPTLASPRFTGPFTLDRTTYVKVRPLRRGLTTTPWHFDGIASGKTIGAIFRRQPLRPAAAAPAGEPGLRWRYHEADWPTLFAYAGCDDVLETKAEGTCRALLDPAHLAAVRATDHACAVRYDGWLRVPTSGVWAFYAPEHLYTTTLDAGYDLRVFIDGEEWFPTPALHCENVWHVPLAAGAHRLRVAYVDYRWHGFRDEYWMSWQPEGVGRAVPVLELSGPDHPRAPLPAGWLVAQPVARPVARPSRP